MLTQSFCDESATESMITPVQEIVDVAELYVPTAAIFPLLDNATNFSLP